MRNYVWQCGVYVLQDVNVVEGAGGDACTTV